MIFVELVIKIVTEEEARQYLKKIGIEQLVEFNIETAAKLEA